MLDVPILDGVERLVDQSPYFAGQPRFNLMHSEGFSIGTPNRYAHDFNSNIGPAVYLYQDTLDCFLFRGANTGTPLYRVVLENWALGQPAVTLDTTLLVESLVTDGGFTWAVVKNSSGVDGLYRRDASVTAPNWTRMVSAANGANLSLWRRSDGTIYYNDATAALWYTLNAGGVGSAGIVAPSGLVTAGAADQRGSNIDFLRGFNSQSWLNGGIVTGSALGGVPSANAETNVWQNSQAIHDNSAALGTATFKGMLPFELYSAARFPNTINGSSQTVSLFKTYRLSSTYSLVLHTAIFNEPWFTLSGFTQSFSFEPTKIKTAVVLLNKTTWRSRYLGVVNVPTLGLNSNGSNAETPQNMTTAGARMKANAIDILYTGAGLLGFAGGSSGTSGLLHCSIPLIKLDV